LGIVVGFFFLLLLGALSVEKHFLEACGHGVVHGTRRRRHGRDQRERERDSV